VESNCGYVVPKNAQRSYVAHPRKVRLPGLFPGIRRGVERSPCASKAFQSRAGSSRVEIDSPVVAAQLLVRPLSGPSARPRARERCFRHDGAAHVPLTPIACRFQWRSAWRPKSPDVLHGWLAEEAAVFAVELAGAFIPDFKRRTGSVQTIRQHASPRGLQPKLFLVLKGTHGAERQARISVRARDLLAAPLATGYDNMLLAPSRRADSAALLGIT